MAARQLTAQLINRKTVINDVITACLQLWEISWNFIDAAGKFNCRLKYDNTPITEPNLVTSLNSRNCHLTIFVQFYS